MASASKANFDAERSIALQELAMYEQPFGRTLQVSILEAGLK